MSREPWKGPVDPPASRPGVGVFSPTATPYTVGAEPSRTLLRPVDVVLGPGAELRYDVFPEFGDPTVARMVEGHGFEATGVAVDLGPEPSPWGSEPENRPFSLTPPGGVPQLLEDLTDPSSASGSATSTAGDALMVFNDTSADGIDLRTGDDVVYDLGKSGPIELYTVSLGPATPAASWILEASDDGDGWERVDEQSSVRFVWDRQTRAFAPSQPVDGRCLRFRATSSLDLRQLEYLRHRPWRVPGTGTG